jgi:hypothetical protein
MRRLNSAAAASLVNARRFNMMVARWSIVAKFGYKQDLLNLMEKWINEIGPQVGYTKDKMRLLTGSVGAQESVIQTEHLVKDLAELNASWDKLGSIPAHKQWSKDIEPYVVSGTNKWEIYRVIG